MTALHVVFPDMNICTNSLVVLVGERAAVAAAEKLAAGGRASAEKDKEAVTVKVKEERVNFSDDVIDKEDKVPGLDMKEFLQGERARILLEAQLAPEKFGSSGKLGPLLVPPGSVTNTPKKVTSQPTANGPTRIPQRRGPLNLTLDLSVTNSWSSDWEVLGNPSYDDDDDQNSPPGSALDFSSAGAVSGFQDQQSRQIACSFVLECCRKQKQGSVWPCHDPSFGYYWAL